MSDSPLVDPLKDPNVKLVRSKGNRGGQPGNKNALRHGFYARNLGMSSPSQLNEPDLRNLLGEAAMLKDYMYILYNNNLESHDSLVLAETLRALSMAGMALSRLLQVHNEIRIVRATPNVESTLSHLLSDMNSATSRANSISSRITSPLDDDADED